MRFSALGQRSGAPAITRLMTAALETPGLLSLAAGFTDTASLPCEAVKAITADLLGEAPAAETLQYGTNQGRPGLRRQVATHVASLDRSSAYDPDLALITNGSQQALYLAMQVLADPGDIVLVDRPSYFVFLEMLKGLGLRAVTLPTKSEGGLDLDGVGEVLRGLRREGEADRIKALYFISYFSNPSSRSLDRTEKAALAACLEAHGVVVPVLEDAAYRDLYFDVAPEALSVLAMPEWASFPRLYLGTLTKPFATGLKVGFGLCSDRAWLERMLNVKGHQDFGTANFNQAVLEQAMATGRYGVQVERVRKVYREKRDALDHGLRVAGMEALGFAWEVPAGGLYLWLRGPGGLDTSFDGRLFRRATEEGVLYVPGDLCFGDQIETRYLRVSFGVLPPGQLHEAAARLVRAATALQVS